ncbi:MULTISPECIES: hypothetical protein [unclassified Wolbachia]|uniref:hypothetical protein n=1 Tax=unclassified Wolbachia TaxID=2640676 RepID=UPI002231472A|nr:hypothetical protein [Wolbachia endosymbiont (group A) of Apoderus coryli]
MSGLAGALSALIFLTAIHIAAKIAIIISAAVVTYLLLSLIHKIRTKKERPAEITGVSEDEGYSSVDEGEEKDMEISEKEPKKEPKRTETELEEELKNKRAQERMEKRLLGDSINAFSKPIIVEIIDTGNSNPVDYTKTMVVPEKIILGMPDDKTLTQNSSSSIKNQMKSPPEHMDVSDNPLPGQPSRDLTNVGLKSKSTQKLSAAKWLSQYGSITNNSMRMPERLTMEDIVNQRG